MTCRAWYGEAQVLRDVDLDVDAGSIVTLVGRNGAGKTTLLRCVMGLHRQQRGDITYDERPITQARSHTTGPPPASAGCRTTAASTPASPSRRTSPCRRAATARTRWPLGSVYETFPVLRERRRYPGTRLSGGEQQMLAIARVLRTGARLLLCDEPTEGLAPILVRQIGDILRTVREHGVTVLLIEQNLHFATTVADRHYLLAEGRIAESLDNGEVEARQHELLGYLGI